MISGLISFGSNKTSLHSFIDLTACHKKRFGKNKKKTKERNDMRSGDKNPY